jgi:predicted N-acyltransferase
MFDGVQVAPSLRVLPAISDVARADWDALLDPLANPFVSWTFLDAMERSGCAAPAHGWRPRHLTLWRDGRLVAAAPTYLKGDHEGDFARDWIWADAIHRAGVRYYPRLFVTVPVTPVPGRRVLVAGGEDRPALTRLLVEGARAVAADERASSVHVLYAHEEELPDLVAAGMAPRVDFQAHWVNRGYRDPADFLARGLDAKQRYNARKERARPAAQGIEIRTVRGDELAADRHRYGRLAHSFYHATISKMRWGRPWLNAALFERIFADMPGPLELVVARHRGRDVAGAFNVHHQDRLFGRYWGCVEEHDLLHFNVCLHHSIDDCIARGLAVFEGGAGGEHKLHRGFELLPTRSAHLFLDARIDREIRKFLELEGRARAAELERWHHRRTIKEP